MLSNSPTDAQAKDLTTKFFSWTEASATTPYQQYCSTGSDEKLPALMTVHHVVADI